VKAFLARTLAVIVLLVALGAAPAQAHQRTEPTRVTISANKTRVDKGRKVKFSGALRSDWRRCRAYKRVSLYRGGTPVLSKKTTRAGTYSFTRRVRATKTWRVKFSGKRWGTHPHVHRCLASSSRGITVRVRN
jgi:hypothetical protein